MPSLATQKTAALARLAIYLPAATEPQLTSPELDALLAANLRANVWVATTAYVHGDKVTPTSRNGHVYTVLTAGTSAATEPTWTVGDGSTVTDGTVTWQEVGEDWENVYDIRAAIESGWMQKAAKVSELYAEGGEQMQQVFDHCIKMAVKFRSVKIA